MGFMLTKPLPLSPSETIPETMTEKWVISRKTASPAVAHDASSLQEQVKALQAENQRLQKMVNVLMDRVEQNASSSGSEFSLFQSTVLLEDQVRQRTMELEQAMQQVDESNHALELSLDELHKTQENLIESEKMAALGNLVSGIAHEINTPIGVGVTATSYLSDLIKQLETDYQQNQLTQKSFKNFISESTDSTTVILKNLTRAADLILNFKQIAVDQSVQEKRRFNVKEYIENILVSLKPILKQHQTEVKIDCDSELVIHSYPGAFLQIFNNLVINSIHHGFTAAHTGKTHAGKTLIDKIRIRISREGSTIKIIYQDNGQGISEQHIPHIFEPFFTTSRATGCAGLGLNIVYNHITQTLGGQIQLDNHVESGVRFSMSIPL